MRKTLIFYWYIHKTGWHWTFDIHLKHLSELQGIFDKKRFVLSIDKDTPIEHINETINKLKETCPDMTYEFFMNDAISRESSFFFEEIVLKLPKFGDDEAIFFAHNKGVQTTYISKERCVNWINDLYVDNLANVDEINGWLNDENVCCIGTHIHDDMVPPGMAKVAKYGWHYAGTFFWLVPKRIYKYVVDHEEGKILGNTGRYYAEGFLATILPYDNIHVKGYKKIE